MCRLGDSRAEDGEIVLREHLEKNEAGATRARKPYSPPSILHEGDVRGVVLGGSPGTGDSGAPGTQMGSGSRQPWPPVSPS